MLIVYDASKTVTPTDSLCLLNLPFLIDHLYANTQVIDVHDGCSSTLEHPVIFVSLSLAIWYEDMF